MTLILTGIIVVLTLLLALLYRRYIRPMRTLRVGTDLLKSQDFSNRLCPTGHKEADGLVKMFNGMMDRLHHERLAVRETNRYLDLLIGSSPLGVMNFDHDGRFVMANPAALRMLGCGSDDLVGRSVDTLPGRIGEMAATLRDGAQCEVEARPDEGDDSIYRLQRFTFFDYGLPRTAILIEPMTELVRRTERKAYEQLVRTMAHEINNTMGAVISTFGLLKDTEGVSDDADMMELLDSCESRCVSLCGFVDRYADVCRMPAPSPVAVDVADMIERMLPMLGHAATTRCPAKEVAVEVAMECVGSPDGFTAFFDPMQMERVLVNMVTNSAESIMRRYESTEKGSSCEKGRIIVRVNASERTVSVIDNGAGIAPETASRLFTPFFTTKTRGTSAGTGLTLIAAVLRAHSFRFSLRTDPATHLTEFRITLD